MTRDIPALWPLNVRRIDVVARDRNLVPDRKRSCSADFSRQHREEGRNTEAAAMLNTSRVGAGAHQQCTSSWLPRRAALRECHVAGRGGVLLPRMCRPPRARRRSRHDRYPYISRVQGGCVVDAVAMTRPLPAALQSDNDRSSFAGDTRGKPTPVPQGAPSAASIQAGDLVACDDLAITIPMVRQT